MENKRYFEADIDFSDPTEIENCMNHFSVQENDNPSLNFDNFKDLMRNIFTDAQGKSYDMSNVFSTEMFNSFDANCDGKIDATEFRSVWNDFIKPLVQPVTALLVIDVQNDFIDGSLALKNCPAKQDAKSIIPAINNLMTSYKFDVVAYTIDYHPKDHISFIENVKLHNLSDKNKDTDKIAVFDTVIFDGPPSMSQKLWPAHCVQNTWGCKLHEDLKILEDSLFIYKGQNSAVDSYSAFFDNMKMSSTVLHEELKKRSVTHVLICGLAFDYCVALTALDALELGYATTIIEDVTGKIDDNSVRIVKENLISHNCVLTNLQEVESLITGKNRKVEFASILLESIKKAD